MYQVAENKKFNIKTDSSMFTDEQIGAMSDIFTLTKTGHSGFFATKGDTKSKEIQTTATTRVDTMSAIWDGKNGWRKTMFVPGAQTIFVNSIRDQKTNEIIERGLDADPGFDLREARIAGQSYMQKGIRFDSGQLNMADYGNDPILKKFLANHECNVSRPGFDEVSKTRNSTSFFFFKPTVKEKNAIILLDEVETTHNAIGLVLELKKQKKGSVEYDVDTINAYAHIFGIGGHFADNEYAQKLGALIGYATSRPKDFEKIIKVTLEECTNNIGVAIQTKVISETKQGFCFAGDKPFFEIKKSYGRESVQELALYLCSKVGANNYDTLQSKLVIAKATAASN